MRENFFESTVYLCDKPDLQPILQHDYKYHFRDEIKWAGHYKHFCGSDLQKHTMKFWGRPAKMYASTKTDRERPTHYVLLIENGQLESIVGNREEERSFLFDQVPHWFQINRFKLQPDQQWTGFQLEKAEATRFLRPKT